MSNVNFTRKRMVSASEKLPAGVYVGKILQAKIEPANDPKYSDKIILCYDIEEGESKGFFKTQYDANTNEDKKWKGIIKVSIPKEDSEEWVVAKFGDFVVCIEESNKYSWNGDTDTITKEWKNKLIGVGIRDTSGKINGKFFEWTEYAKPFTVEEVRSGKAKTPKRYDRDGKVPAAAPETDDGFMAIPDTEETELPF